MTDPIQTDYYVITRNHPRGMLLYSLPDPNDDESWTFGQRFSSEPETPIAVEIITGYETWALVPYFDATPLISHQLYEVLLEAGVDNLDVYDAVIRSEDGSVEHTGYKAFNVIGLVSAAGPATSFDPDNASRLLDASIDSLSLDEGRARGIKMFRLAEHSGTVLVHRSVKEAIEARGIPHIQFVPPAELIT